MYLATCLDQKKSRIRHRHLVNTQVSSDTLDTFLLTNCRCRILLFFNLSPAIGQYKSIQRYTEYFPINQLPVYWPICLSSTPCNWRCIRTRKREESGTAAPAIGKYTKWQARYLPFTLCIDQLPVYWPIIMGGTGNWLIHNVTGWILAWYIVYWPIASAGLIPDPRKKKKRKK